MPNRSLARKGKLRPRATNQVDSRQYSFLNPLLRWGVHVGSAHRLCGIGVSPVIVKETSPRSMMFGAGIMWGRKKGNHRRDAYATFSQAGRLCHFRAEARSCSKDRALLAMSLLEGCLAPSIVAEWFCHWQTLLSQASPLARIRSVD